jgi:hypothetical protein
MGRVFSFLNYYNVLLTLFLTVVGIMIGMRSCHISELVEHDDRQIDSLHLLISEMKGLFYAQQQQLENQQEELKEIKDQTPILLNQYKESRSVDNHEFHVSEGISRQLRILERQNKDRDSIAFFERRKYSKRLQSSLDQIQVLSFHFIAFFHVSDKILSKDTLIKRMSFMEHAQQILEREMDNAILMNNDSLWSDWVTTYKQSLYDIANLGTEYVKDERAIPDGNFPQLDKLNTEMFYDFFRKLNRLRNRCTETFNNQIRDGG